MPAARTPAARKACSICDKVFERSTDAKRHEASHTKPSHLMHYCIVEGCSYHTLQKNNVNQHIKAVHLKLKHNVCQIGGCDKKFSDPSALIRHEKQVHKYFRKAAKKSGKLAKAPALFDAAELEAMLSAVGLKLKNTGATIPDDPSLSSHNPTPSLSTSSPTESFPSLYSPARSWLSYGSSPELSFDSLTPLNTLDSESDTLMLKNFYSDPSISIAGVPLASSSSLPPHQIQPAFSFEDLRIIHWQNQQFQQLAGVQSNHWQLQPPHQIQPALSFEDLQIIHWRNQQFQQLAGVQSNQLQLSFDPTVDQQLLPHWF